MNATGTWIAAVACIASIAVPAALADIHILRQPASLVVNENCPATFSVVAEGTQPLSYQWLRDDTPIPGATASEYVIPHVSVQQNGGRYNVQIWNAQELVISSNAYLSVTLDVSPPVFSRLFDGPTSNTTLVVRFQSTCGGLNKRHAEDIYNYDLADGEILSAELLASGQDVLLTTAPLIIGFAYQLRIESIQDIGGNGSWPVEVSFTAGELGCPIEIDQEPQDRSIGLGYRGTFNVTAHSVLTNLTYQWERSDPHLGTYAPVNGATQSTLTLPPARSCAESGYYRCRIAAGDCAVYSRDASLDVSCDCEPPFLISATPLPGRDGVIVGFDVPVTPVTAADIFNYDIAGLEILDAEMKDSRRVLLRTTPQTPGQLYTIVVNDVSNYGDPSCGRTEIWPNSAIDFRAPAVMPGVVRQEIWRNIYGSGVGSLESDPRFPDLPDETSYLRSLELPRFVGDFYGVRLSGFLTPPEDGEYRFFMSLAGDGMLSVSTNEVVAGTAVRFGRYARTPVRDFRVCWECLNGPYASEYISLRRGQQYYFDLLFVSTYYPDDHAAVTWQKRGAPEPGEWGIPIQGTYLGVYAAPATNLTILEHPHSLLSEADCRASFSVIARVQPPNALVSYQWQVNGTDIPGANEATYRTGYLKPSDNGSRYRCRVFAPGLEVTSHEAELILGGDVVPPTVEGAFVVSSNNIMVLFDHPVFAGDIFNYRFDPPLNISNVSSTDDPTLVLLQTETMMPGLAYKVTVEDVRDTSGNVVSPTTVHVQLPAGAELQTARLRNKLVLYWSWRENAVLQRGDSPQGPWSDLPPMRTPFILDPRAGFCSGFAPRPNEFFRLRRR